jgi:hypothetical protein
MSDFDHLSDSEKTLLKIKLDGYVEAAVQAARLRNVGLLEALSLTATAVVREVAAYSLNCEDANEIWSAAIVQVYGVVAERGASRAITN